MNNYYTRRTFLAVPYKEKDEAKMLGAWWDPEHKKWYVPAGRDTEPFRKWFVEEREEKNEANPMA